MQIILTEPESSKQISILKSIACNFCRSTDSQREVSGQRGVGVVGVAQVVLRSLQKVVCLRRGATSSHVAVKVIFLTKVFSFQEGAHEWGSKDTLKLLSSASHIKWAKAACRWREVVSSTKQVSLPGFIFLLCCCTGKYGISFVICLGSVSRLESDSLHQEDCIVREPAEGGRRENPGDQVRAYFTLRISLV